MMRRLLPLLSILLFGGLAAGEVPELMERAVLPYTSDLPTCACTVPMRDGEQLVVGLANGEVVSFHESAGRVIPRIVRLPGSGPVDAMIACRAARTAGSANEFALLAVRGRELVSVGFGDMNVAGHLSLPRPAGRYRFAMASRDPHEGTGALILGADHPVLYDDESAMCVYVHTRTLTPVAEPVIDDAPGLMVTALSDRVTAVVGPRIVEFPAEGGVSSHIDERLDPEDEPVRVAFAHDPRGGRVLELRVSEPDSVWVSRTVTAPGTIAACASLSDSLVAIGGSAPLTDDHDIGWVALVGPDGDIIAMTDHASPVTNISRVSGFVAVQGGGRNLSIYDMDLRPLWDHDSPVRDAVLLPGHFAWGESEELAVVGTREFYVSSAYADSIRKYLNVPEFAAGAIRAEGGFVQRRSFITVYVSNEDRLRRMLIDASRGASDAFESGETDLAIEHATTARAAAAVLGDHGGLTRNTTLIGQFESFTLRRRSLLLASLILATLGVWVAVECARGTALPAACAVATALLLAAGAWSWKLIGDTGLNPALFAGGAIAGLFIVRGRVAGGPRRHVSGAAIEDLIRALMEFLHGAGEGVPSDGVVDAARKSVTKVAYLAQEMVDSIDEDERYAMLLERLRERGGDFLDTTYPRVAVLLSHAKRAGFVVAEAEQMARAAERMRAAITAALSDAPPKQQVLRQHLLSIKEGRDQLATAADRAWAIVQTNPGCSLTRSLDRILKEKEGEFRASGVRVERRCGVPRDDDAVALWSFELRFIFENLVTNAMRAMRSSKERVLTIETVTDGAMFSVRISDTGAGMDETLAAGLFAARDDERNGGYGMPNSRLRLQEHGGDLVLERTGTGEGTIFLMTIPHWTPLIGESDA